jgi:hypothetical protein
VADSDNKFRVEAAGLHRITRVHCVKIRAEKP